MSGLHTQVSPNLHARLLSGKATSGSNDRRSEVWEAEAVNVLLPGAGLYSCSMLRLSGPKSCQLLIFHMVNKSPMQKTAPCTCTSFTMKPASSYLGKNCSVQALSQQVGESCNSRTYPSILTRPASATMRSYSSALVASDAACPLCSPKGPIHLRTCLRCCTSLQPTAIPDHSNTLRKRRCSPQGQPGRVCNW